MLIIPIYAKVSYSITTFLKKYPLKYHMKKILVTGGAGYIGTHTGYKIVVVDKRRWRD